MPCLILLGYIGKKFVRITPLIFIFRVFGTQTFGRFDTSISNDVIGLSVPCARIRTISRVRIQFTGSIDLLIGVSGGFRFCTGGFGVYFGIIPDAVQVRRKDVLNRAGCVARIIRIADSIAIFIRPCGFLKILPCAVDQRLIDTILIHISDDVNRIVLRRFQKRIYGVARCQRSVCLALPDSLVVRNGITIRSSKLITYDLLRLNLLIVCVLIILEIIIIRYACGIVPILLKIKRFLRLLQLIFTPSVSSFKVCIRLFDVAAVKHISVGKISISTAVQRIEECVRMDVFPGHGNIVAVSVRPVVHLIIVVDAFQFKVYGRCCGSGIQIALLLCLAFVLLALCFVLVIRFQILVQILR